MEENFLRNNLTYFHFDFRFPDRKEIPNNGVQAISCSAALPHETPDSERSTKNRNDMKKTFCASAVVLVATSVFPTTLVCAGDIHHAARSLWVTQTKELVNEDPLKAIEKDRNGNTPLHLVCSTHLLDNNKVLELARFLIESGADVNAKNNRGTTPLYDALRKAQRGVNNIKLVSLLLESGADPEAHDNHNVPAMLFANAELAELILSKYTVRDDTLNRLTSHTIMNAMVSVTAVYVYHGALNNFPTHRSAATGDLKNIRTLHAENADSFTEHDQFGFLPIHWAAFLGELESVKEIASRGLDINAKSKIEKFTPLHLAAHGGHHSIVEFLLTSGADAHSKARLNLSDRTPLDLARNRYRHLCVALLERVQKKETTD